jgi:hypothetical protein
VGLADGGFAAVWTRIVGGVSQIWYGIRNADGTQRFIPAAFDAVGNNATPTITALQDGGFAIAYSEDSWSPGNQDISYAQFNASGTQVGSKLRVTSDANADTRPDMTTLSNGMVVISYAYDYEGDGSDIDTYAALVNPATPSAISDDEIATSTDTTLFNAVSGAANGAYIYTYTDTDTNIAYAGVAQLVRSSTGDGSADVITGDALQDDMYGQGGDDTLNGNAGDDHLSGGPGTNTLNGGTGEDTAFYSANRAGFSIIRNLNGTTTISGGGQTDILNGVEFASFSDTTVNLGALNPRDFNGDNRADLLMQYSDSRIAIWLMDGPSMLSGGLVGTPGASWHAKASADFSGDGKADILMQNDDGRIAVWKVDGSSFTGGAQIGANPGIGWHVKDAADFNGDGIADVLMQHDDSRIAIWFTSQLGFVSGAQVGATPGTAWVVKGTGDFDGDGKTDLVMQRTSGEIVIWKLDNGNFSAAGVAGSPGAGWHVKSVGDFNNDGKSDLLFQHDDSRIAIWTMNGFGMSGAGLVDAPGSAWAVKGAYDTNADGMADIVMQRSSGEVAVWTMNGIGRSAAGLAGNPGAAWALVGPTGG